MSLGKGLRKMIAVVGGSVRGKVGQISSSVSSAERKAFKDFEKNKTLENLKKMGKEFKDKLTDRRIALIYIDHW